MKNIILITIGFMFLSCDNCYMNIDEQGGVITRKTKIEYTSYGNQKTVTYFQNKKPSIDSIYYFDNDYPETFYREKKWLYNENGLIEQIITTDSNGDSQDVIEISYDEQLRLSSVANNYYHRHFEYNDEQITSTYLILQDNTTYVYQYGLDENGHIISKTNPSGLVLFVVEYMNDDLIMYSSNTSNFNIDYIEDSSIPLFMKRPEFGPHFSNYVLFTGAGLSSILNIGHKFIIEMTNENGLVFEDLQYTYEFNADGSPSYILKGILSSDPYSNYIETYFEYE